MGIVLKPRCNETTLQPFNLTTFQQPLELRERNFRKHCIPERGSITHRSEAQRKKEMTLYAHDQIGNAKLGVLF